jgi:hypothetical protein
MSKGGAVGVAQSPIAHARASIAKLWWTPVRVSRFAKTSANIWNPFRARFERAPIVKNGVALIGRAQTACQAAGIRVRRLNS